MIFYSWQETLLVVLAAIVIDWLAGDPRKLPHPVIGIGKLISALDHRWRERAGGDSQLSAGAIPAANRAGASPAAIEDGKQQVLGLRMRGIGLAGFVTSVAFAAAWCICAACAWIHPWLGYAAHAWLVSTTIAVKGLKDAALLVYAPLAAGDMAKARQHVGFIVGRDTAELDEPEVVRATVETVAENTVDAFVSPVIFALLGAAPLALFYRAANTLDSMVGYNNARYRYFGWASAQLDDVLNFMPARLTGWLLAIAAGLRRGMSARRARLSVRRFAKLHPSPNSGIPEAAVAGALGVQLGGTNRYGGVVSERARLGWAIRPLEKGDVPRAIRLLYDVSYLVAGGCLCAYIVARLVFS